MSIDTNYVYINVNTNIENRHKRIEIYIIGTSILCFKKIKTCDEMCCTFTSSRVF
jgi:hypothetical protein